MKHLFSIFALSTFLLFTNCSDKQISVADQLRSETTETEKQMYVIERDIPNAGMLTEVDLKGISQTSCDVIDEIGTDIQWLHSYVTNDKVYCVYMASDENVIKEHAKRGGFPANAITKVSTVIDPSTAK